MQSVMLIHLLISETINDALCQDMRNDSTLVVPSYRKYHVPECVHTGDVSPGWTMIFTRYLHQKMVIY